MNENVDSIAESGTEVDDKITDSHEFDSATIEPGTEMKETPNSNTEPRLETDCNVESKTETTSSDIKSTETNDIADYILTPFLHKILTELILMQESVPLILNCEASMLKTSPTLSLCHDTTNFHPSFGVGSTRHYLKMSSTSTVRSLQALINKEDKDKSVKTVKQSSHSFFRRRPIVTPKVIKSPKPEPSNNWKLGTFEIKKFSLDNSSPPDLSSVAFFKLLDDGLYLDNNVKLVDVPKHSESILPTLQVVLESDENKVDSIDHTSDTSEELLKGFISKEGMSALAQCLPFLYPYQWPQHESTLQSTRPSQVSFN